jgi:hypothetical protein
MRPDETILRMGRKEIKEKNGKLNSPMKHCKNFVNVTMHPQYKMVIKKLKTK